MRTMEVNCFTNATLHVNNNIKAPLLPQFFFPLSLSIMTNTDCLTTTFLESRTHVTIQP